VVRVIVGAPVDEVTFLIGRGGLVTQGRGEVMAAVDVLDRRGGGELVVGMVVAETAIAEAGANHGERGERGSDRTRRQGQDPAAGAGAAPQDLLMHF
jgi:hypothetical protein